MPKVPDSGKGHRHTMLIAGIDAVLILDAATRLNNRRDASLKSRVNGIAKRKKRIAHHDRIFDATAAVIEYVLGPRNREVLERLHAIGLPLPCANELEAALRQIAHDRNRVALER